MVTELLPLQWPEGIYEAVGFKAFVALDHSTGHQMVGTLTGYLADSNGEPEYVLLQLSNDAVVKQRVCDVAQAWIAPMGYRAPARGWKKTS